MVSPEVLGTNGMSSVGGELVKSLSSLGDNSTFTSLENALRASSAVGNADYNFLSSSWESEGKFGDFDGRNDAPLTIKDDNGKIAETFSLTGDGYGEVFKNTELNFEYVFFAGTDAITSVAISAINNIRFGDYLGSSLNVQTSGSITAGNITLQNTNSSRPGLSLRSGLSDVQSSVSGSSYSFTDLGALPGGNYSRVHGINNRSQVVGESGIGGVWHDAFLYSDGKMTDLGTLFGNTYSTAYDINDSGQVVGHSYGNGQHYAFLYSDGKMTDLGTLPGSTSSHAVGINNSGQVVGEFRDSDGKRHAFLYSDSNVTDLGTLPGSSYSNVNGINNSGQVVGYSSGGRGTQTHAFLYSDGKMTDLGTLPGDSYSYAYGINDSGQVVGESDGSNGWYHAFLYSDGKMTDLGTLPEGSHSTAYGINDSGQVVGESDGSNGWYAFLYSDGKMTDLNSLIPSGSGWTLNSARAINDFGQIVGDGSIAGQTRAFLLDPISGLTPTPKDGITVGNISTLGSSILLQGLRVKFTGSDVITKGGKITIDAPTVLNSSTGTLAFNSTKSTANSKGGDIIFKNTVDGETAGTQSLSLTAGTGNITFNNAVGGNATLLGLKVSNAKTVTAKGDITSDGNITISATQNITTLQLTSNSGAVKLTSNQGAVATQDITSGSDTTIAANQSITTGSILSNSGAVKLTSKLSAISTGDISTGGNSVTIAANNNIDTHKLDSQRGAAILTSIQGAVTITGDIITNSGVAVVATQNITTNNIRSQNGVVVLNSNQGAVSITGDITASSYVNIAAGGNIDTRNILSTNRTVRLISSQGTVITTGNITNSGGVAVVAPKNIITNKIRSQDRVGVLNNSVDLAVRQYLDTANGPIGNRNYYKTALIPIASAYIDFFNFFVFKFNSEVIPVLPDPRTLRTELPDGTKVIVRPTASSIPAPTDEIQRPTGAPYKVRYLPPVVLKM